MSLERRRRPPEKYSPWERRLNTIVLSSYGAVDLYRLGTLVRETDDVLRALGEIGEVDWSEKFHLAKAFIILDVLKKRKDGADGLSVHSLRVMDPNGKIRSKLLLVFDDNPNSELKWSTFAPSKLLCKLAGGYGKLDRLMKPFDKGGGMYLPAGYRLYHRHSNLQKNLAN